MTVTEEKKFAQALSHVRRYELYRILRAWGAVVIAVGLGSFFSSFSLVFQILRALRPLIGYLTDEQVTILGVIVLGVMLAILVMVATIMVVVAVATYQSTVRLTVRNQDITTRRVDRLGVSLFVLFGFTFFWTILMTPPLGMGPWICFTVLRNITPWYLPATLGVLLASQLLRAEISEYEFTELRNLIFVLLILSVIEFSWRVIFVWLINPPWDVLAPATIDFFDTMFYRPYLLLDFLLALSYGVSGLQSWRRASQVLKGKLGSQ
jgi:hypothetical protein